MADAQRRLESMLAQKVEENIQLASFLTEREGEVQRAMQAARELQAERVRLEDELQLKTGQLEAVYSRLREREDELEAEVRLQAESAMAAGRAPAAARSPGGLRRSAGHAATPLATPVGAPARARASPVGPPSALFGRQRGSEAPVLDAAGSGYPDSKLAAAATRWVGTDSAEAGFAAELRRVEVVHGEQLRRMRDSAAKKVGYYHEMLASEAARVGELSRRLRVAEDAAHRVSAERDLGRDEVESIKRDYEALLAAVREEQALQQKRDAHRLQQEAKAGRGLREELARAQRERDEAVAERDRLSKELEDERAQRAADVARLETLIYGHSRQARAHAHAPPPPPPPPPAAADRSGGSTPTQPPRKSVVASSSGSGGSGRGGKAVPASSTKQDAKRTGAGGRPVRGASRQDLAPAPTSVWR